MDDTSDEHCQRSPTPAMPAAVPAAGTVVAVVGDVSTAQERLLGP